ncbi:MAG TPA: tryptophan--tRNA ligase [Actinomycetota bacterium]|nr:tryptophan--tRNA ligase [Actinomycetota bacterium]
MARVFSGVKPTGDVHLGNYIGAFRHFVTDQDEHDCIFCIVDLHAITVPQDPKELREASFALACIYLAVGVDPARSTLFVQSHVHEHAELAWVLGSVTMYGELRRMTQFKDRMAKSEKSVTQGIFSYPVLMAADILLYDTDRVPVGEDQRQHLELTRDIAQRFNSRYGETFVVPQAAIAKVGARIMDLQNPEGKMSKSEDSPQGTIDVLDSPDAIRKKIKTAVTDSGKEIVARDDKPAIANLLSIYSVASGKTIKELEAEYAGKGYGDLKKDLADALVAYLEPIQERYKKYASDPGEVARILQVGAEKAQSYASKTLATVYDRVGFLPRLSG